MVDHRRERGGFAGSRRARDQDHALVEVAELVERGRQVEALHARNLVRNIPKSGADSRRFAVDVDAEAPAVLAHVGEVEIVSGPKALLLRLRENLLDVAVELRVAEISEFDRHEVAEESQHGRDAHRKMHVGAALRQAELEKGVDSGHAFPTRVGSISRRARRAGLPCCHTAWPCRPSLSYRRSRRAPAGPWG